MTRVPTAGPWDLCVSPVRLTVRSGILNAEKATERRRVDAAGDSVHPVELCSSRNTPSVTSHDLRAIGGLDLIAQRDGLVAAVQPRVRLAALRKRQ